MFTVSSGWIPITVKAPCSVCINESRSSFLLTLPLILLKPDPYHLYQVWNGWELNCLCVRWQELTGLMFHQSSLKVTTLRRNKRERLGNWLENQMIRCYHQCLNHGCHGEGVPSCTAVPPNPEPQTHSTSITSGCLLTSRPPPLSGPTVPSRRLEAGVGFLGGCISLK